MPTSLQQVDEGGVTLFRSPLLDSLGFLAHAFSTRRGGVSEGSFASLNLSGAPGEKPGNVRENRRRFFAALGLGAERAVGLRQAHGRALFRLDGGPPPAGTRGDGLMASTRGPILTVQTADCPAVLLAAPASRAVVLLHAGWRGTGAGIVGSALRALEEAYGAPPRSVFAALGPSIRACCYEVGEEVLPHFRRMHPGLDGLVRRVPGVEGKYLLDLVEANRQQLLAAGVPPAHIDADPPCTCCRPELFYSYRRDGRPCGRLLAAAALR
ncbi:MAG: peptidoglycan editing factor PgeF [Nitrospinota bacterium]